MLLNSHLHIEQEHLFAGRQLKDKEPGCLFMCYLKILILTINMSLPSRLPGCAYKSFLYPIHCVLEIAVGFPAVWQQELGWGNLSEEEERPVVCENNLRLRISLRSWL